MMREPVPQFPGIAVEYGDAWKDRLSLSEMAAALQASFAVRWEGDDGLFDLYCRLHLKYLGVKLTQVRNKLPIIRTMVAVSRFCDAKDLDLPLYIAAQMRMLQSHLPYGFQPHMLLGDSALGRYNAFIRKMGRRLHHAMEDAATTADTDLQEALFTTESSIGAHLTAAAVNGVVDWEAAVVAAEPSFHWRAMVDRMKASDSQARQLFVRVSADYGVEWVNRIMRLSRLQAAVAVADRYRPNLSERIGCGPAGFDWIAFAELIAGMFATESKPPVLGMAEIGMHKWG